MQTKRVKSWPEAPSGNAQNQTSPPKFAEGHSIAWYAKEPINNEDTLLGERYLCRTGGMFIVAPSGMGKSTLSIQIAILWCCGLIAFGIRPRKALRILIVQSEDDKGDCTEMSQMIEHLKLNDQQKLLVQENTEIIRCSNLVSRKFIDALRTRLEQARDAGKAFDLVIINPYGVYLGTDVKDTEASVEFLNEWLNSVLLDFNIAAILIHHTAKTNFQNTDKYKIWDWMYHGAGCACITNWARAILAIKPETEDMKVYRFIAAKRGQRIGEDWNGEFERFFAWSSIRGVLRWEEATGEQIAKASSAKSKVKIADLDKVIECVPLHDPELKETVENKVRQRCTLSRDAARAALKELCATGRIFEREIPNPKPKRRGFAGWSQTNGSTQSANDHQPPEDDACPGPENGPDQPFPGQGTPPD
jgi:AAA domain-containing protein